MAVFSRVLGQSICKINARLDVFFVVRRSSWIFANSWDSSKTGLGMLAAIFPSGVTWLMRVRVDFPPPVSYFGTVWPPPIVSSDEAWPPSIKGGRWLGGLHCTGALDRQLACVGWIDSRDGKIGKNCCKLGQIKKDWASKCCGSSCSSYPSLFHRSHSWVASSFNRLLFRPSTSSDLRPLDSVSV